MCGRLFDLNEKKKTGTLRDISGSVHVDFFQFEKGLTNVNRGDIVQLNGYLNKKKGFTARGLKVLVPWKDLYRPETNLKNSRWYQLLKNQNQVEMLKFRSDFLQTVRRFFLELGFIEIDAPSLIPAAGMELHIEPFVTNFRSKTGESRQYFLHTSPEFTMKKMLVAGFEKIFYLGHTFRNGELAGLHSPEFSMIEWYRAYQDYTALMNDCRELVNFIELKLARKWQKIWRKDELLKQKWEIVSLAQLMKKYCRFDLKNIGPEDNEKMVKIARSKGLKNADKSWPIDDLFFILFLEFVEPELGKTAPLIVKDYPIWMASLAKRAQNNPNFVERFELYIDTVELANAFTELNDPEEQYLRLSEEQKQRRKLGRFEIPIDTDFIHALQTGMPPAAGIALGLDRLMMVCSGQNRIAELLPYSVGDIS